MIKKVSKFPRVPKQAQINAFFRFVCKGTINFPNSQTLFPLFCALPLFFRQTKGSFPYGNGTSFACPLIAGMAACVWSALPDLDAQEIRRRIICSADRYHTPDADYGIPDAWLAYLGEEIATNTMPSTNIELCKKIYRNRALFIRRGGQWYDLMGRKTAL